jgi:hypothetical protein
MTEKSEERRNGLKTSSNVDCTPCARKELQIMRLSYSRSLLITDLLTYKLVEVDRSSDEMLHLERGWTFSGMLQDQAIRES